MSRKKNPHWGTTLDEFLAEDGIREAAKAEALARLTPEGTLTNSFADLVQRRAAGDAEFAEALLREGIELHVTPQLR